MKPIASQPCPKCINKAELDPEWDNSGYDPRMRRFICEKGHDSYRLISKTEWYNDWLAKQGKMKI